MFSDDPLKIHREKSAIHTLVEQRTTYNAGYSELNIFETREIAHQVKLTFDFPVIASMISGKKKMHLEGMESFDFIPGESVIMPENKPMIIDFPIACMEAPTQCLALGIDKEKIDEVVSLFNEKNCIERENNNWTLDQTSSHLLNNPEVNTLVHRLTRTFTNDNSSKDVLLDLMIQELIVRLLQTKAKGFLLSDDNKLISDTRLGYVIKYIRENFTKKDLNVDILADKACMSTSHFHKTFKNTLGISPIDYLNTEKIKFAKNLMKKRKELSINEIAYLSGFNNTSYFIRKFKSFEHLTPSAYKQMLQQTTSLF